MANVYEFPVKMLPEEMENCLYELGKEFGEKMYYTLDIFADKYDLDIRKDDIMELVTIAYAKGVLDIMDEL